MRHVHAIGDSHVLFTFSHDRNADLSMPGVSRWYLGARTMRKVSHLDDPLLPTTVSALGKLERGHTVLCSFGEIDLRCHLKPVSVSSKRPIPELVKEWSDRYLHRVQTLDVGDGRAGVVSILPPVPTYDCDGNAEEFPVSGSDQERAGYVRAFNAQLVEGCMQKGLLYLDVYSPHADANGMMRAGCSDGHIHLRDNRLVRPLLESMGLL